jgi:hypothetical protein
MGKCQKKIASRAIRNFRRAKAVLAQNRGNIGQGTQDAIRIRAQPEIAARFA